MNDASELLLFKNIIFYVISQGPQFNTQEFELFQEEVVEEEVEEQTKSNTLSAVTFFIY